MGTNIEDAFKSIDDPGAYETLLDDNGVEYSVRWQELPPPSLNGKGPIRQDNRRLEQLSGDYMQARKNGESLEAHKMDTNFEFSDRDMSMSRTSMSIARARTHTTNTDKEEFHADRNEFYNGYNPKRMGLIRNAGAAQNRGLSHNFRPGPSTAAIAHGAARGALPMVHKKGGVERSVIRAEVRGVRAARPGTTALASNPTVQTLPSLKHNPRASLQTSADPGDLVVQSDRTSRRENKRRDEIQAKSMAKEGLPIGSHDSVRNGASRKHFSARQSAPAGPHVSTRQEWKSIAYVAITPFQKAAAAAAAMAFSRNDSRVANHPTVTHGLQPQQATSGSMHAPLRSDDAANENGTRQIPHELRLQQARNAKRARDSRIHPHESGFAAAQHVPAQFVQGMQAFNSDEMRRVHRNDVRYKSERTKSAPTGAFSLKLGPEVNPVTASRQTLQHLLPFLKGVMQGHTNENRAVQSAAARLTQFVNSKAGASHVSKDWTDDSVEVKIAPLATSESKSAVPGFANGIKEENMHAPRINRTNICGAVSSGKPVFTGRKTSR